MEINDIITILLMGISLSIGAILGTITNKIFATKEKNNFYYAFYVFSFVIILISFCVICFKGNEFSPAKHPFHFVVLTLSFISGIILFISTKFYLVKKYVFTVPELNPIVNTFTSSADKNEIKLFGGDLNFLGNSTSEIDNNVQYTLLKSLNFKKISIICEEPNDPSTRLRYGKILSEMPNTEIKFYDPEKADLRVRGRIIEVNGVSKLLMYTKNKPGSYETLETDTANSSGALYDNIWALIWSMAKKPSPEQLEQYINTFKGK
ncbi:MAG: hypothetical protein KAX69_00475 [Chitinophagales bacterium]|nr:hypothetical protein [Chitinophagales bacterium]